MYPRGDVLLNIQRVYIDRKYADDKPHYVERRDMEVHLANLLIVFLYSTSSHLYQYYVSLDIIIIIIGIQYSESW